MRYTLMHISDLHAGSPFLPQVAEVAARQAHELRPDLLVISGDFVQRASFFWQWKTIKSYLQTLPQPQLVVPGNHDVPLFDGFSRLLAPMNYYYRHISQDLHPVFSRPGLTVAGGNSAHGLTMDGGFVSRKQREALEQTFANLGPETCKVVVMHHPVVDPPAGRHKSKVSNWRATMQVLERCEVDLFLCGHVHFSYIDALKGTDEVPPGALAARRHGMIVCQCGTTTSRRGRGTDRGKNSFNVIEIDEQTIRIQPHFYIRDEQRFVPVGERIFERHGHLTQ